MLRDPSSDQLASDPRHAPAVTGECPVCGASSPSSRRHGLSRCNDCGHVFQTNLTVSMAYDAAYAHRYDSLPHRSMSALRWDFIATHLR